jgi:uracil-DNA glycosylase
VIVYPSPDCPLCPRLAAFRAEWRRIKPEWFNAPVPSFGIEGASLIIVGLAPGLQGANRTGRPFTGDHAGILLYETLLKFGFACGIYDSRRDDGLQLIDARIVNAVRCVPPQNKPTPQEIMCCRQFLAPELAPAFLQRRAIVALGRIAHDSTLRALGKKPTAFPFSHGAQHKFDSIQLFDSYHCSRYNTNTGRLTKGMFENVFEAVRAYLGSAEKLL